MIYRYAAREVAVLSDQSAIGMDELPTGMLRLGNTYSRRFWTENLCFANARHASSSLNFNAAGGSSHSWSGCRLLLYQIEGSNVGARTKQPDLDARRIAPRAGRACPKSVPSVLPETPQVALHRCAAAAPPEAQSGRRSASPAGPPRSVRAPTA